MLGLQLLLVAFAALRVEGSTTCPSPAELAAVEAPLAPVDVLPSHRVLVEDGEGALLLRLVDGAGVTVGERSLPPEGSCADRARAGAVILAAWESDLRAHVEPPREPIRALGRPAPQASRARKLELGAGLQLSFAGSPALGAMLFAAWMPGRLGVRAVLHGSWPRDMDVGQGQARWNRLGTSAGPAITITASRLHLEASVELAAALLSVEGEGFAISHSDSAANVGISAGLRARHPAGPVLVWGEFAATGWFTRDTVEVRQPSASEFVPAVEFFIRAGASLDL